MNEWIVFWNRVCSVRVGTIHIDSQDRSVEIRDVLTRAQPIWRRRNFEVTDRNVEITIGSEKERAAIVTAPSAGQYCFLACEIESGFRILRNSKACNVSAIGVLGARWIDDIANVSKSVFQEVGMKHDAVDIDPLLGR